MKDDSPGETRPGNSPGKNAKRLGASENQRGRAPMESRQTEGAKGESPSGNRQGEALLVGLVATAGRSPGGENQGK